MSHRVVSESSFFAAQVVVKKVPFCIEFWHNDPTFPQGSRGGTLRPSHGVLRRGDGKFVSWVDVGSWHLDLVAQWNRQNNLSKVKSQIYIQVWFRSLTFVTLCLFWVFCLSPSFRRISIVRLERIIRCDFLMFVLVFFCSKQTLDYQGLFQVKPPFRVESTRIADEVTDSPAFLQLPKVKLRPTLCLLEFSHSFIPWPGLVGSSWHWRKSRWGCQFLRVALVTPYKSREFGDEEKCVARSRTLPLV